MPASFSSGRYSFRKKFDLRSATRSPVDRKLRRFAAREGPYDPLVHPVQIVSPRDGVLTWLVDRAAAASP
jgi:hypothetical protein